MSWSERARARESQVEGERDAALRFISRRHAHSESEEVLASRRFPVPTPRVARPARPVPTPVGWPVGTPPRPIRLQQLWSRDGTGGERTVQEMRGWVRQASSALAKDASGAGAAPARVEDAMWSHHLMPEWAQGSAEAPISWDVRNPEDCVPLHLSEGKGSLQELVQPALDTSRFREWHEQLGDDDFDMLHQVCTGVVSRSEMPRDTAFMMHHQGLRRDFEPARASVDKDTKRGWMTTGTPVPPVIPARVVAKNCVEVHKWKLDALTAILVEVAKSRVTTDDGLSPDGTQARNELIDRLEWRDVKLGRPQSLAEAVAIAKAAARELGVHITQLQAERIVLWTIDLSDAYRILVIHYSELWQQMFIWLDGVRLDARCVFGAAHMVGFFQRVSSFVLRVASSRLDRYDVRFPVAAARQAWVEQRQRSLGGRQRGRFEMIYLDDAAGLLTLPPGTALHACNRRESIYISQSRGQATVRIVAGTFIQAGWGVSWGKVQLNDEIEFLGLSVDAEGAGRIHCSAVRSLGMRHDISAQQKPAGAGRAPTDRQLVSGKRVERLVGRMGHLAQIEPAAGVHMPGLYTMERVTRPPREGDHGRRRRPGKLAVWGETPAQERYQQALAWWDAAFERGLQVPLAPELTFPGLDEPGVLAAFTDAASEHGTGVGAFAPVWEVGETRPIFLYSEERWSQRQQQLFDEGAVSMPMGELYGGVAFLVALLGAYPDTKAVYWFTDCDAAKAAVNSSASPSPQMNHLLRWLFEKYSNTRLLALHIPGKRNWGADGLSRDGVEGATVAEVLESACASGMRLRPLELPEERETVFVEAAALPQSAKAGTRRRKRRRR